MALSVLAAVVVAALSSSASPVGDGRISIDIVSRVGDHGVPDDRPKRARRDQGVTLYAVLVVDDAGGAPRAWASAPVVAIGGRRLTARPLADGPRAELRWSTIEPSVASLSNTASGAFRFERIPYAEVARPTWRGGQIAADVRPTLLPDRGSGVGTMRYRLTATIGGRTVATPGPEAPRARGAGGVGDEVHRVSLRRDDTALGYLTELFGQPYVWASAGTSDARHQSERLEGLDCADFVVYGRRRQGRAVAYSWTGALPRVTRLVARGTAGADGIYRDARGVPLPYPTIGDSALFPRHVGVLGQEIGPHRRGRPRGPHPPQLLRHPARTAARRDGLRGDVARGPSLELTRCSVKDILHFRAAPGVRVGPPGCPRTKRPSAKMAETVRVAQVPDGGPFEGIRQTASLLVVQGAEVDLGRHVLLDRPITLGRDERVDLTLNDGSISRAHCSVERDVETGRYVLVDLGSTNGTAVNGIRVRDRVPLTAGDKIFLGASVIRFSFSDAFDVQFHERLGEMVSTDPLTGMASKRQYDAIFAALVDRAVAEESALAVVVMDLDGLKQINDTHGHEFGSFAIAEVAAVVRHEMEPHGHVARFGGDEFVACLPGMLPAPARELAERVRGEVERHRYVRDGIELRPTLTLGVGCYPGEVADPKLLFTHADHAMYRAKRAGKNRVGWIACCLLARASRRRGSG